MEFKRESSIVGFDIAKMYQASTTSEEKVHFTIIELYHWAILDDALPKHHSRLYFAIIYIVTNTSCKDYSQILSLVELPKRNEAHGFSNISTDMLHVRK